MTALFVDTNCILWSDKKKKIIVFYKQCQSQEIFRGEYFWVFVANFVSVGTLPFIYRRSFFRKAHLGNSLLVVVPSVRCVVLKLKKIYIYLVKTKGEEEWKTFAFQELTCDHRWCVLIKACSWASVVDICVPRSWNLPRTVLAHRYELSVLTNFPLQVWIRISRL